MLGIHEDPFPNLRYMVAFKYSKKEGQRKILQRKTPLADASEKYAATAQQLFPARQVTTFVIYIVSNLGYRIFKLA